MKKNCEPIRITSPQTNAWVAISFMLKVWNFTIRYASSPKKTAMPTGPIRFISYVCKISPKIFETDKRKIKAVAPSPISKICLLSVWSFVFKYFFKQINKIKNIDEISRA